MSVVAELVNINVMIHLLQFMSSIIGVIIGWALAMITRYFDETLFGAKLKVDCQQAPGKRDETPHNFHMKFRVQNSNKHRVAKNCRAYLVALHRVSNNKLISENLINDTFQLPWPNNNFAPRDIPAEVSQYVDLVHFSKESTGWKFVTDPFFYPSHASLAEHRGIYRFTVVVAGDEATPQTKVIYVDYDGEGKNATPYE